MPGRPVRVGVPRPPRGSGIFAPELWTIGPFRANVWVAVDEPAGGLGLPGWFFCAQTGSRLARPGVCLAGSALPPNHAPQADAARAALPRRCAGRSSPPLDVPRGSRGLFHNASWTVGLVG
jgi:hypothetical protein